MNPLMCFIRAHLQRRLFMWFGATIFFTGIALALVMGVSNNDDGGLRREAKRLHVFIAHRFEAVWDSPAERDALAQSMSRDLDASVVLRGEDHRVLATFGKASRGCIPMVHIERQGHRVGRVDLCAERYRGHFYRAVVPFIVTGLLLWTASGVIARRLSRPLIELARVAREIGAGNLSARVRLRSHHRFGEADALSATMNDMAARLERHLAQQRELLAAVSHELRTPLARIRLITEMIREGGPTSKLLEDLDREVIEIDALVGDLLASSRMDFAELSLSTLDAIEVAQRSLERAGVDPSLLALEPSASVEPRVHADATLLARALANLIDNARKHGGGVQVLRVRCGEATVAFEVEDQGAGFEEGEEHRVFEPFYRRSEHGSLGLGLSLVKRIAEAHQGRAYAENRREGGARVGLELSRVTS